MSRCSPRFSRSPEAPNAASARVCRTRGGDGGGTGGTGPWPDGGYRFPHGLARQAVLDLMSEFQRAQDNAAVAAVLEDMPAADLRVQRLADHYAAAAALGYTDKAVHYLAESAELAQAGLAHDEAARLFERAAAMAEHPALRDELRLKAARGYLRSSRFGRARQLNELVASGAHRHRSAAGGHRLRGGVLAQRPSGRALCRAADPRPGRRHSRRARPTAHQGVAALGRAYAFTADVDKAAVFGERATALARETGDDRLIAAALQIGLQRAAAPGQLCREACPGNGDQRADRADR